MGGIGRTEEEGWGGERKVRNQSPVQNTRKAQKKDRREALLVSMSFPTPLPNIERQSTDQKTTSAIPATPQPNSSVRKADKAQRRGRRILGVARVERLLADHRRLLVAQTLRQKTGPVDFGMCLCGGG